MADGPDRQYTDELYDRWGYLATWVPGARIGLGDCGPIEGHKFSRARNIRDFGFKFEPGEPGPPLDWEYKSQDGVNITFQLRGENKNLPNIPAGKAGIDIGFTRKHAVVMAVKAGAQTDVDDIYQLQKDVLSHYRRTKDTEDEWPKNYAVISSVIDAKSSTILIADNAQSHFGVTAEADIKAALVELADVDAKLDVATERDVSTRFVAQTGLRPLFKAFRIKDPWWRSPEIDALEADELPPIGADDSPFEWVNKPDASWRPDGG